MAEYVLRQQLHAKGLGEAKVISAGTHAFEGARSTLETLEVLKEEGVNAETHQSRRVTLEMMEAADAVFAMTETHREWLVKTWPRHREKVRLFAKEDVPDPIGQSVEIYRECLGTVKYAVVRIIKEYFDGK